MKIEFYNLFTHFIIITKNRAPLIVSESRERIEKYITGVVNNNDSRLYSIYANPEHVHLVGSRSPKISEERLLTVIADSSQRFISEHNLCPFNFEWQQSASAFSISKSNVDQVCKYVLNQQEHHKKVTFRRRI